MSKLPIISGNQAIKCFEKIGYQVIRQQGSHVRMRPRAIIANAP
jgi:predicted RNA binding protein YcfA (HicA-like mRNA interferase family)